ncbi:MAG: galactokinase, partial [Planctomycetes bacterium]|nr:galactokinase [Planctomycetota bacterium]
MVSASAPLDEERHAAALEGHARAFETSFRAGGPPRLFFAPGRVNLMGAHLDYNGGPVMPTAIDRGTFLAARPRADRRVVFASLREAGRQAFSLDELPDERTGSWADYPLGVLRSTLARQRAVGRDDLGGVEILFGGNLPVGAGLSSSASICVGTATVLDALWELEEAPLERVASALEAEREFVGVQCGIMDPYAVGLARPGHILWLDCKDRSWEHLPLDFSHLSLAVADTGVRRELAEGAFNERVAECGRAFEQLAAHALGATCLRDVPPAVLEEHRGSLAPNVAMRAEHVLREVERTFEARAALLAGDAAGFGGAMTEAHASLRDSFEVSCAELDRLVE